MRTARSRLHPGGLGATVLKLLEGSAEATDEPIGRLRSVLARQYAEILRHDPGVRLDLDPEDAHLAARGGPALPRHPACRAADARPRLVGAPARRAQVARRLARAAPRSSTCSSRHLRDQIEQLEQPERTAAGTLVELLAAERGIAQAIALDALTSERYYWLLDGLEAAARGPQGPPRRGLAATSSPPRSSSACARSPTDSGPAPPTRSCTGPESSASARATRPSWPSPRSARPARPFVEQAKAFQDVLGAHQDAIVAEARLRGLLADSAGSGAAFAAGRLVERERARRRGRGSR